MNELKFKISKLKKGVKATATLFGSSFDMSEQTNIANNCKVELSFEQENQNTFEDYFYGNQNETHKEAVLFYKVPTAPDFNNHTVIKEYLREKAIRSKGFKIKCSDFTEYNYPLIITENRNIFIKPSIIVLDFFSPHKIKDSEYLEEQVQFLINKGVRFLFDLSEDFNEDIEFTLFIIETDAVELPLTKVNPEHKDI